MSDPETKYQPRNPIIFARLRATFIGALRRSAHDTVPARDLADTLARDLDGGICVDASGTAVPESSAVKVRFDADGRVMAIDPKDQPLTTTDRDRNTIPLVLTTGEARLAAALAESLDLNDVGFDVFLALASPFVARSTHRITDLRAALADAVIEARRILVDVPEDAVTLAGAIDATAKVVAEAYDLARDASTRIAKLESELSPAPKEDAKPAPEGDPKPA